MGMIFEILFELIVDGSVEALGDKKVPAVVRVLAALVLIVGLGGLVGLVIIYGIADQNWLMAGLGAALGAFFLFGILRTVKKRREREKESGDEI
ncbi:MAG: hypothetical protein IJL78_02500 [Lachnospiraceae bacterium]|nr:hypothetical protein [Lachnospiraceae bacterium]